jgi:hypothetical protein
MATNKPVGDNARKGAVKKRSQLTTETMGKKTFTRRNKVGGQLKSADSSWHRRRRASLKASERNVDDRDAK